MNTELVIKSVSAISSAMSVLLGQLVDIAPILLAVAGFYILVSLIKNSFALRNKKRSMSSWIDDIDTGKTDKSFSDWRKSKSLF
ncbi:hypothetical protein CSB37_02970 [bacterium DOLZORAL124_38_8]|nr:MAG: hypothetical protein CSB37_02970 [bacterium DOLZORAL124_38_8]